MVSCRTCSQLNERANPLSLFKVWIGYSADLAEPLNQPGSQLATVLDSVDWPSSRMAITALD
jgi:hypothetical protein